MVSGKNLYDNVVNAILYISLIVLSIGLILFFVGNKEILKETKYLIIMLSSLLVIMAMLIIMIISHFDTITIEFSNSVKISSIVLISVAFIAFIASILVIRENVINLVIAINNPQKILYILGQVGIGGACGAHLYNNKHKLTTIGVPVAMILLNIAIGFIGI